MRGRRTTEQAHCLLSKALRDLAAVPTIHTVDCAIAGECRCWRVHVDAAIDALLYAKEALITPATSADEKEADGGQQEGVHHG
jgi:hypothetical protein